MAISIQGSFKRSINLVRDFYGQVDLGEYILTAKCRELISRMAEVLAGQASGGAWSITGPYGGGKSAFALFMTHLLRGNKSARIKLAAADEDLCRDIQQALGGVFCPILVVGSREPLDVALLRGLAQGAKAFLDSYARRSGRPSNKTIICRESLAKIISEAEAAAAENASDSAVIDLYQRVAAAIHRATGGGLLLIVDELGKLLEYTALYPDRSDVYALQRLAERASRQGGSPCETAPLVVFTILHQAFERYAGRLNASHRDEWRKVQGRFEDFAFIEPVSETVRLLAHALHLDQEGKLQGYYGTVINRLLDIAYLQPGVDREQVRHHLAEALPLHPAVSLIVGPLFRRLAQDRRSLFAFLGSGEPGSFLEVIAREAPDIDESIQHVCYRLDHLYDYLVNAIGPALHNEQASRLWAESEAAISRIKTPNELSVRCIKQITLLGFAGPLAGLPPTTQVLRTTLDARSDEVDGILDKLKAERLVTYRPFKDEYHIWQGSEFDLDAAIQEAREQVPIRVPLARLLEDVLPPSPIVARRHSYRVGATRVFEVQYCSDKTWRGLLEKSNRIADGRVIYVLPELEGKPKHLLASIKELAIDPLTLIAVPDQVSSLHRVVWELACLKWVRENVDELKGDGVARREIDQQLADLSGIVEQRLSSLLVSDDDGFNPCTWIHQGNEFRLKSERDLQEKLSQVCDDVFADSPEIWNELLNRRKPSASAVKGLKLLIQAMLEHGTEERLGIQKYPAEYGMYASTLLATGIHRRMESDPTLWHFARPDSNKHAGCAKVWDAIASELHGASGRRVSVQLLQDKIRRPPFGVREGLIPVFLFALYKSAEAEIAVYENGTFVTKLDYQTIERFLKSGDNFELQWVKINDSKAAVLQSLAPLVGLPASAQDPLSFVLRMLRRIHDLPPYVRKATMLSQTALNVRETLRNAVEPMRLLFEDLPEACGISSFLASDTISRTDVNVFAERLQQSLRELSGAYDALIKDLRVQIARVFRLRLGTSDECRHQLAKRARDLLPYATNTKIKAFLVRASDEILDTRSWYESLAALLVRRPPSQWRDEDLLDFRTALHEVARRFYTLETIAFEIQQETAESKEPAPNSHTIKRVRLSVTMQYENEHEQVIDIHPEDSDLVERVRKRLHELLTKENVMLETKIAAVAQLSSDLLEQRAKLRKPHE